MKKLLVAALIGWLASAGLSGQTCDQPCLKSSQLKLGVNKGLGGDAVKGLGIKVNQSTSGPASG